MPKTTDIVSIHTPSGIVRTVLGTAKVYSTMARARRYSEGGAVCMVIHTPIDEYGMPRSYCAGYVVVR